MFYSLINKASYPTPTISVIMPVYNTATYLHQCIDSVLWQTFTDFELICINDGSTDNSAEIISQYAVRDNRIKVIEQSHQGQSVARNKALKIAKGKYISFIDSDDFYALNFLQVLYQIAKETKVDIVCCNFQKIRNKEESLLDVEDSAVHYKIYKNPLQKIINNIPSSSVIWNKLYRADVIKHRYFIEGIYFEDWPWVMEIFTHATSIAEIPCKLYGHNVYSESTIRSTFTKKKVDDYVTGIRFIYNLFQQDKYKQYWRLIQKKRISASIKMMINKVYHEKKHQPELNQYLLSILKQIHQEKFFYYRDLPFKVLVRLEKIHFKLWRNKYHAKN